MPRNYVSASAVSRGTGGRCILGTGLRGAGFVHSGIKPSPRTGMQSWRVPRALRCHHHGGQGPVWPHSPTCSNAKLRAMCPGQEPVPMGEPRTWPAGPPAPGGEATFSSRPYSLDLSSPGLSDPACAGLSTNPCSQQVTTAATLLRLRRLRCRRKLCPTI